MPGQTDELIAYEEKGDSPSPDSAAGFVLTSGDLDIFKLLGEFRFLRREHISALTGRPPKRLHRRIVKLIDLGYLKSIRLPQQKHIYGLGKGAAAALVEQGIVETDLLDRRIRVHELKDLFLKHEMMIVDVHVGLTLAAKSTEKLQLAAWREGNALFDAVIVTDHRGTHRLPIRPDAFFTIEDARRPQGTNQVHFFLEADRSSTTQTRFEEKIIAYWQYLEQGLHMRKHAIKNFRVLTTTVTHKRAENLCALATKVLPERAWKYYLFTGEKFSQENAPALLSAIYLSPRQPASARHPLIPPPAASQTGAPVV